MWLLAAAGLFLGSAVLQLVASLQRWVVFSGSRAPDDLSAEDHVFDYRFPMDPWESVGSTAELFGAGLLIQALGVLCMAVGVLALSGSAARRSAKAAVLEIVLALLVAGSLGVNGAHALASGAAGAPSPLQHMEAVGIVGFAGLVALAVLWRRRLPAAMAACLFLLGSSGAGYFVATYLIAPVFAGGISHDTTPWTETVVAASTAAAGLAIIVAARAVARRGAGPV